MLALLAVLAGHAVGFELPAGWKIAGTAGEDAVQLAAPAASRLRAEVIVDGKISDAELEGAAAERHAARVENRVAWGMRADAGPPREPLRLGGRPAVRFRDRIGSSLGSSEQLMTCAAVAGRLACVISIGPRDERETAETLASAVLTSLTIRKK